MTIPSHEQVHSISISVFEPLIQEGGWLRNIDHGIDSYTHTIAAVGGFISCDITMKVSETEADEWISVGLGRHIVAHGVGGEIVWEGFVDNVMVSMGNITIERGRLTEVCNRCIVRYTSILDYDDETGNPITDPEAWETPGVDDAESIEKYGIWENVVSGGTLDELLYGEATYMRDTYLAENKDPEVSHNPSLGGEAGAEITVTLNCRGYYDWLQNYVYEGGDEGVSCMVHEKIIAVLTADPNDIISTNYARIDFNGLLTYEFENEDRTAMDIINECVSFGDENNARWMFGVYENREAKYNVIPSDVEYIHYVGSGSQQIALMDETPVPPWNVRPGKFARIQDILIGRFPLYSQLREDKRVMFVEQVTFTAPNSVDLQCKKISTVDQFLARYGA